MAAEKQILIIDDELDVRTYLSTLFEDYGYTTILAKDGDEALKQLQTHSPALITLDISMPEKSGVKFYREIKEDGRWKGIPVIIVTGVSNDFQKFISSRDRVPPPDGFVAKPVDQGEILRLVMKLTGG